MNSYYKELFTTICQTMEVICEQEAEKFDREDSPDEYQLAKDLHAKYIAIAIKFATNESLEYDDIISLLAAATTIAQRLERKVQLEQEVIDNYREDLIPKLAQVVNGKDFNEIFSY